MTTQLLSDVVRRSAMAWLELHGEIIDAKKRKVRKPELKANFIQLKEEEILEWMEANGIPGRLIKLKGRRQGSSTGSLARGSHRCRQRPTAALICGLDYNKNCKVMKRIFDQFVVEDSFDWGVSYDKQAVTTTFSNGSSVELLSANTGNAARGEGYQWVLMTEVAFYPDTERRSADDFIQAVFQCVPREPGTEIIIESTPNGEGGKYHSTWTGAISFDDLKAGKIPKNWNNFVKLFYPWHEHPEYTRPVTPDEAIEILTSLSDRERELMSDFPHIDAGRLKWRREVLAGIDFEGDEDKFEIEYPSDEFRCFAGTGRKRFHWEAVKALTDRVRPGKHGVCEWKNEREDQATFEDRDEEESWLRVWEPPKHGCRYSLIVDPMTGEQANGKDPDNHGIGVLRDAFVDVNGRWWPPALVARITDCHAETQAQVPWSPQCRWALDVVEERVARVSAWYGWCQIVVEMNKDLGLVELLKKRPRANLYRREVFNRKTEQTLEVFGWLTLATGQTGQRSRILEALAIAVRNWDVEGKGIDIPDRRVLHELGRMIVKENGREEAGPGAHDDTVLMLAIGLATIGKATPYYEPQRNLYPWRKPRQATALD